ncbi:hypothetical protein OIU76_011445 [Salix suchowensis]|nr:hypothetical protein OIU76_011445 [Salix suchowensis]
MEFHQPCRVGNELAAAEVTRDHQCPESLKKFREVKEKCLADEGKNCPTMGEVLWHLEYILQLQEAWMRANATEMSCNSRKLGCVPMPLKLLLLAARHWRIWNCE